MPAYRFYVASFLNEMREAYLEEDEAKHAIKVMRVQPKDKLQLFNGHGILAVGEVVSIEQNKVHLSILSLEQFPPFSSLILAFALPRLPRIDAIIEKGTELGVTEFWIFPGEKSEKIRISEIQKKRFHKITISSSKQSGRLYIPEIVLKPSLEKWESCPFSQAFFGDLSKQAPSLFSILSSLNSLEPTIFFTGPESGFSKKEEKKLISLGVKGVKLHPFILRADTASITAASLLSQKFQS